MSQVAPRVLFPILQVGFGIHLKEQVNLITLTTCSELTTFDTYVSVYQGGCGALTCVAGNDDQSEPFYDDLCIDIAFAPPWNLILNWASVIW